MYVIENLLNIFKYKKSKAEEFIENLFVAMFTN